MASKRRKTITLVTLVALIAGFIGYQVYTNRIKTERDIDCLIGIDKENSIAVVNLSTEKGKSHSYLVRSHVDKGFLWKYPIERVYREPLYEKRYRRDVMLKDGEVSFYHADKKSLIKFDYETGEVLKTLEMNPPVDYLRWTALQDKDTLYLISAKQENEAEMLLKAVDFKSFSIKWEYNLGKADLSYFYKTPFQNSVSIVLHKEKRNVKGKELLILNKKTGKAKIIDVGDWGFLKGNKYYYISGSQNNNALSETESSSLSLTSKQKDLLVSFDLSKGETQKLFHLGFDEDGKKFRFIKDAPYDFSLWYYGKKIVYIAQSESDSNIIVRDIETGTLDFKISLPDGFEIIGVGIHPGLDGAPDSESFPDLKSRYLPFVLGATGDESFDSDMIEVKISLFDLVTGSIAWESNPVFQHWYSVEHNIEENNFYDEGKFGIFLPIPQSKSIYPALLLINAKSGEVGPCLQLKRKGKYGYLASDFTYRGRHDGDQRIFNFSDRAFFLSDGTIFGRHRRRYEIEDLSEEMGDIYGF